VGAERQNVGAAPDEPPGRPWTVLRAGGGSGDAARYAAFVEEVVAKPTWASAPTEPSGSGGSGRSTGKAPCRFARPALRAGLLFYSEVSVSGADAEIADQFHRLIEDFATWDTRHRPAATAPAGALIAGLRRWSPARSAAVSAAHRASLPRAHLHHLTSALFQGEKPADPARIPTRRAPAGRDAVVAPGPFWIVRPLVEADFALALRVPGLLGPYLNRYAGAVEAELRAQPELAETWVRLRASIGDAATLGS
jgi:hypothetical protein